MLVQIAGIAESAGGSATWNAGQLVFCAACQESSLQMLTLGAFRSPHRSPVKLASFLASMNCLPTPYYLPEMTTEHSTLIREPRRVLCVSVTLLFVGVNAVSLRRCCSCCFCSRCGCSCCCCCCCCSLDICRCCCCSLGCCCCCCCCSLGSCCCCSCCSLGCCCCCCFCCCRLLCCCCCHPPRRGAGLSSSLHSCRATSADDARRKGSPGFRRRPVGRWMWKG